MEVWMIIVLTFWTIGMLSEWKKELVAVDDLLLAIVLVGINLPKRNTRNPLNIIKQTTDVYGTIHI